MNYEKIRKNQLNNCYVSKMIFYFKFYILSFGILTDCKLQRSRNKNQGLNTNISLVLDEIRLGQIFLLFHSFQ